MGSSFSTTEYGGLSGSSVSSVSSLSFSCMCFLVISFILYNAFGTTKTVLTPENIRAAGDVATSVIPEAAAFKAGEGALSSISK